MTGQGLMARAAAAGSPGQPADRAADMARGPQAVPGAVRVVETAAELAALADPGTAAVIWWRPRPAAFAQWIDALPAPHLPQGRRVVRPDDLAATAAALCASAGMPACPGRDWLVADIAALGAQFAALMRAPFLRLRLEVVETDACRRFHIDAVTARLLCTYRGTGTQYGLGRDGGDPDPVHTLPTGAAMVMRGRLWPVQPCPGLVHRSPPIAGSGESRLLLVLDPAQEAEEAVA